MFCAGTPTSAPVITSLRASILSSPGPAKSKAAFLISCSCVSLGSAMERPMRSRALVRAVMACMRAASAAALSAVAFSFEQPAKANNAMRNAIVRREVKLRFMGECDWGWRTSLARKSHGTLRAHSIGRLGGDRCCRCGRPIAGADAASASLLAPGNPSRMTPENRRSAGNCFIKGEV